MFPHNAWDQADFLTAVAQIAVGLAGFTGVASAFASRPAEVPAEVQAERLRAMIEATLVAVIFSLVPLLLYDLKLPDETLWRLPSGLYLAGWACTFAITVWRGFEVLRRVERQADRSWGALHRVRIHPHRRFVASPTIALRLYHPLQSRSGGEFVYHSQPQGVSVAGSACRTPTRDPGPLHRQSECGIRLSSRGLCPSVVPES